MTMIPATDERPRVLVVDDEKFIRDILEEYLTLEGYLVRAVEDGAAAVAELSSGHFDIVVSDLRMPRMGGIELLAEVATLAPSTLTIIMTGFGTVETAIEAMKLGAFDYILKPFKAQDVIRIVQRALEKQRLAAENIRLREAVSLYTVSEAIATSLSFDQVLAAVGDTAINELKADLVSTWLDDGEGHFIEMQRLVSPVVSESFLAGALTIRTSALASNSGALGARLHGVQIDAQHDEVERCRHRHFSNITRNTLRFWSMARRECDSSCRHLSLRWCLSFRSLCGRRHAFLAGLPWRVSPSRNATTKGTGSFSPSWGRAPRRRLKTRVFTKTFGRLSVRRSVA